MTKPFTPWPYQRIAADHIIDHERCAIWIPVGGGKCAAVLMAFDELSLVEDVYPTLIIAPKRVARDTWPNEASKWDEFSHITVSSMVGTQKERTAGLNKRAMFYSINFECIEWLIDCLGDKWPFKNIVFDEASRLRGYRLTQGTKRSQALSKVAHANCKRFIELTGSPSPNGLSGLWGQMAFLDKGQRLGRTYTSFEQRWFTAGFDGWSLKPFDHAQGEIQSKVKDICLSIDLKDYMNTKEPVVNNIIINLPPAAAKAYKTMEKEFFMELENHDVEAFNAASKSGKLLQVCQGAAYIDDAHNYEEIHDEKIQALESLVEESNGMPIFVVTNFVSDRMRLLKHFPKAVDLATTPGFNKFLTGTVPIGLAHGASLGHGVDGLQYVTNLICFFGIGWDLELYDQITGRIGPTRQLQAGFDRPVFIHHIIARNTIDELVLERLQTKRSVQDVLLTALKKRSEQP